MHILLRPPLCQQRLLLAPQAVMRLDAGAAHQPMDCNLRLCLALSEGRGNLAQSHRFRYRPADAAKGQEGSPGQGSSEAEDKLPPARAHAVLRSVQAGNLQRCLEEASPVQRALASSTGPRWVPSDLVETEPVRVHFCKCCS